jgi:hypothetical protein
MAGRAGLPKAAKPAKVPSVQELKAQKTAAYGAVEQSGHRYTNEEIGGMVNAIKADIAKKRYDPDFHPAARLMVTKLEERVAKGVRPTLTELDDLRQFVRENVVEATRGNERRIGRTMIDGIDQFIEGAGGEASELIGKARSLNARYRKVEGLTEAVAKGERAAAKSGTGGNVDNAIRQKVSTFLDKTPNLSPEERAAVERIVYGSKGQNTLRQLGRLSPQGNGLMQAGHMYAATQTGGLSALAAGGGAVAKHMADNATKTNVAKALRIMAMDRPSSQELETARKAIASLPQSDLGVRALQRELASRFARAGGLAAGQGASAPNASPAR